jgi:hypothetical protein
MLNAKLVVVGGDAQFDQVELKLPVVIGRGLEVDLAVSDELISRRHAEITEQNGRLMVRDLGSRNGTFVNNRRIDLATLEPEQLLTLGTITFRALYQVDESGNGTVQVNETVRINFNETERLSSALSFDGFAAAQRSGEKQDDLETVDMDEYQAKQNSAEPQGRNQAARETVYADRPRTPVQARETIAASEEAADHSAQYLRRRFPK